ncbi:MAG: hypothetical protein ACE5L7_08150 [Candidatus Aminicenantales bacterium]
MRKKTFIIFFIFLASLSLLFYSCGGSPETPKSTKQAVISIDVSPKPVTFTQQGNRWCSEFDVIITETNGVSGRVDEISILIYSGTNVCDRFRKLAPGRFLANSTTKFHFSDVCVTCDFDKMEISVQGADDNGNKIFQTISINLG